MSPEVRAFFLAVAIVLFVAAAIVAWRRRPNPAGVHPVALLALGLAAATIPAFWDAWDLATA